MANKWAKQRSSDPLVLLLDTNIAMEEEIQKLTAIASTHNFEAVDGVIISGVICEPRLQANVAVAPEPIIVAMEISTTNNIMMPNNNRKEQDFEYLAGNLAESSHFIY